MSGVAREDLLEVRVRAAVGLHHVEDDLVHAVAPQEGVDVPQVRQVAVRDDGGGVELDAEALQPRDRVEPRHGLLEAVGRAGEALVELLRVAVDRDVEPVDARLGEGDGIRHLGESPAVGHHADAAVAARLGPRGELGELGARRRLAGGEAHLLGAAVTVEHPEDALGSHRGVVHVAAVAVLLHAEDAVVIADRADGDVQALCSPREALGDRRLGGHGGATIVRTRSRLGQSASAALSMRR